MEGVAGDWWGGLGRMAEQAGRAAQQAAEQAARQAESASREVQRALEAPVEGGGASGGWGELDDGWGFAGPGEEVSSALPQQDLSQGKLTGGGGLDGAEASSASAPALLREPAAAEDFPAPPAEANSDPDPSPPPPAESPRSGKRKSKARRNSKEAKAQGKPPQSQGGRKSSPTGKNLLPPPGGSRSTAWEEELNVLRASVEALQSENLGLSEGLEAASERVRIAQSALDAARTEKVALEEELAALRASKQGSAAPSQGEQHGQLLYSAAGGDSLKEKLVALEKFAEKVGDAEQKHTQSMSEVRKVALEAVASAENAAEELGEAKQHLAEKDSTLSELRTVIEDLRGSSAKLKDENIALKKDLKKSQRSRKGVSGQEPSPEAGSTGSGHSTSTDGSVKELKALKGEVADLKSKLEKERGARATLEEEVQKKDLEISAIHDGASAASSLAVDSQDKVDAAKRELTASASALKAAVAAKDDAENQVKSLTEKLREMEKSEAQSLEGAAMQSVALKDLEERRDALESKLEAKEKEMEEKVAEAVQEAIARQEQEAEALTLEACEVLQSKFQEREEHHLKEAEDLRQSLDDSEQELEAARTRVKELEELEASMGHLKSSQEEKEMTLQQVLDERDDLQTELQKEKDASQERTKRFVVVQTGFKETEAKMLREIEGLQKELKQARSRIDQEESGKAESLEAAEGQLRDVTEKLQQERKAKEQVEADMRQALEKIQSLEGKIETHSRKMAETEKHLEVSNARVETLQAQVKAEVEKRNEPGALAEVVSLRERQQELQEANRVLKMKEEELQGRTRAAEDAKIQVSLKLAEADDLLVRHGLLRESSDDDAGSSAASGAESSIDTPAEPNAEEYLKLRRELQVSEQRNRELAWQVKMFSEPKAQAAASNSLWSLVLGANPVSAASCAPSQTRPNP